MAESKTRPTDVSVEDHIASRASEAQRADCARLMALLGKLTGETPRMWGPSIVGYGAYRYRYDSGRSGESCVTGFAIRSTDLVVYLVAEGRDQAALLARLGKHRMGKSCLYFKRLADLDAKVLEALVASSVAEIQRRHGGAVG